MSRTPPNHHSPENDDGKRYWLDDSRNVDKVFRALLVVCALLFLSDAVYEKHVIFGFEHWFGFFGLWVLIAKMKDTFRR